MRVAGEGIGENAVVCHIAKGFQDLVDGERNALGGSVIPGTLLGSVPCFSVPLLPCVMEVEIREAAGGKDRIVRIAGQRYAG